MDKKMSRGLNVPANDLFGTVGLDLCVLLYAKGSAKKKVVKLPKKYKSNAWLKKKSGGKEQQASRPQSHHLLSLLYNFRPSIVLSR
jgi:hypothetical protein